MTWTLFDQQGNSFRILSRSYSDASPLPIGQLFGKHGYVYGFGTA